jgi:protoheme IX farnesyltransferase
MRCAAIRSAEAPVISATGGHPAGEARRRSARDISRSLLALTQPRIVELVLVTAIPAMLVAQRGLPPIRVALVTLAAGALAGGSANTINCYIGRRTGSAGRRVARRPRAGNGNLPVIKPAEALAFGVALGAAATMLLGLVANWLSAALAGAAILLFVFICTLRLKWGAPSSIVIGVAAGCFPVLMSWSAVTGTLSLLAVVLLAVIFCWAPPPLWTLAMDFRGDTAGQAPTPGGASAAADAGAGKILWYSCVMMAATLGLAPYGGWVYTASATALGAWFLAEAHRLRARVGRIPGGAPITGSVSAASPMRLPGLSTACLAQLFAVIMAVALLPRSR